MDQEAQDAKLIVDLSEAFNKDEVWQLAAAEALSKATNLERVLIRGSTAAKQLKLVDVLIRKTSAAGLGAGSAAGAGLPDYKRRFLELLSLGNIQRPKTAVLNLIMRHCPARMMVLGDCNDAVDLYREAELFPGPSTEGHLLTQHGLRVNGPLFPNPAEGSASLLIGTTREGLPVIVKLLAQVSSADSDQQPGGAEAEACRALMESKPASVPLVPAHILTFKLGAEHKSTVNRVPGLYAALCMPRYVSSLVKMVPLPAAAVLAGGRRMAAALEWIHQKEYTHMDVKGDNIFVDSKGRWWLGDFGSTVRTGSPVTSTTLFFAPCTLLGLPAKSQYDWHMLAVALVCEMNRNSWKELLIKGGCSPPENLIAAVKELHRREGCEELACFLNQLLKRAGYLFGPCDSLHKHCWQQVVKTSAAATMMGQPQQQRSSQQAITGFFTRGRRCIAARAQVAGTARPWQLHEQTQPHQEQLQLQQLQEQLVGAGGMGAGGHDGGEVIRGDSASSNSSSYLNNPAAVFGQASQRCPPQPD
ncbi:hypothetical protein VOLCADRAFT_104361 [Volvox carteri f. nagariensis]|uniref:Protein kinase domain-containing protein n=1 Tax=Volvox carteri f. nagariensis TaxID=3068 RepID=D8TT86_VOLCA|nr:uncharacterized protein VOLCADRAFT_104361 [Volvox carteri f. nagariensis]EFJ49154.1 hypothetical protein VOLCADRAFT_104361 [Volvox carteri f. nagariensis]|eukprot:XP_002949602.1 hypothetical protein VOLCADRAFT_104361 [Volvox carteri f. nagariensis]